MGPVKMSSRMSRAVRVFKRQDAKQCVSAPTENLRFVDS